MAKLKPAPTLGAIRAPIVDSTGMASWEFTKQLQAWSTQMSNGLDSLGRLVGNLSASVKIGDRVEGIGTTVQNITSVGQLNSLTNVAADRNLDHIDDSAAYQRTNPTQVTGAGRAYTALDANSKLPGTSATPNMQLNSVNFATVKGVDLGSTAGAQIYGAGGVGTQWTWQVGTAVIGPYPSGSISGLAYSTKYLCYYDSVLLVFVATQSIPAGLNDYYYYVGTFTTPAAGGGTTSGLVVNMSGVAPTMTVAYVSVTTGGNYTGTPTLSFSGGGSPSHQAAGYAAMSGSSVSSITMTDPGSGYSSAPTASLSGGASGSSGGGGSTGANTGRNSLAGL